LKMRGGEEVKVVVGHVGLGREPPKNLKRYTYHEGAGTKGNEGLTLSRSLGPWPFGSGRTEGCFLGPDPGGEEGFRKSRKNEGTYFRRVMLRGFDVGKCRSNKKKVGGGTFTRG